jgi:hypothetical protein
MVPKQLLPVDYHRRQHTEGEPVELEDELFMEQDETELRNESVEEEDEAIF